MKEFSEFVKDIFWSQNGRNKLQDAVIIVFEICISPFLPLWIHMKNILFPLLRYCQNKLSININKNLIIDNFTISVGSKDKLKSVIKRTNWFHNHVFTFCVLKFAVVGKECRI